MKGAILLVACVTVLTGYSSQTVLAKEGAHLSGRSADVHVEDERLSLRFSGELELVIVGTERLRLDVSSVPVHFKKRPPKNGSQQQESWLEFDELATLASDTVTKQHEISMVFMAIFDPTISFDGGKVIAIEGSRVYMNVLKR
mgnify:CR=1 FL=1